MKYLITIVGPTAIGKTSLSIALAKHFSCEIISCDSRQFFKEISIGTAVPDNKELEAAKHHFIHNKSILENYTVGDFEKEAISKLDELFKTSNFAILVGGSGLYVNAILKGLDAFPEIEKSIRQEVIINYENFGIQYLQQKLEELDPDYFKTITRKNPQTLQNPQRMMRFVEVCIGSNKPYSSFINKKKKPRNFTPIIIGLDAEREIINNRINQRVDLMINKGLVAEAEKVIPYKSFNALQTVGYRELFSYLSNDITLENAIEKIKKNTRQYAKRQMTWFKKEKTTKWFDYSVNTKTIIEFIHATI